MHIPGLVVQPDAAVRKAYWRARQLIDAGWRIHELGRAVSGRGFIAEIPYGVDDTALVVWPRGVGDSGGAAAALVLELGRLRVEQRRHLQRLIVALHGVTREQHPQR